MDRRLIGIARLVGTLAGAFAGIVAVQLMRLRRMRFLPGHPGFYVNHVVQPPDAPTGPRLRMAVLGDSTTAGVGVVRAEDSLPYLIAQRIAQRERRAVHVVSYGWAGARMADLVRSQLPRALEPLRAHETDSFVGGADLVVLVVGANDATHNTPPGRFRADLREVLEGIRAAAPSARVVLAGIPIFRGALPAIEPLIFLADQYARLLRPIGRAEAVRADVAYADLAREVPPRIEGRVEFLSSDRFHPSVVGYATWADVIVEAIESIPRTADEEPEEARTAP